MLEERLVERHVKAFLDLLVLAILNGEPMYGYRIIGTIHNRFRVLLSPGSLYPILHSLKKNKLIESQFYKGRIVYRVTPIGKQRFQKAVIAYKAAAGNMESFVKLNGKSSAA